MKTSFLGYLLTVVTWHLSPLLLSAQQAVVDEIFVDAADFPVAAEGDVAAIPSVANAAADAIIPRQHAGWRFWDSARGPEQEWTKLAFDDSKWKQGQAPLGYGDKFIKTKISFGEDDQKKHRVAFFRLKFDVTEQVASVPAVARIRMDDAAVVYVNAKEVYRFNLPDGPVNDRTHAKISLKPENRDWTFVVDAEHLHAGENIVAVSVHQRSEDSSDLLLDLELKSEDELAVKLARALQEMEKRGLGDGDAEPAQSGTLIALQSKDWKYWDNAKGPGDGWNGRGFDDSGWSKGTAPLGYGDNHIKTTISYGKDKANKHPVAFFRRKFQVDKNAVSGAIVGKMLVDDGAVVYVNAKEVFRYNLPDGPIGESTRTKKAYSGQEEDHYWTFVVDQDCLEDGDNTLAVRVHQGTATSSDLSLDVELKSVDAQAASLAYTVQKKEQRGEVEFAVAAVAAEVARPVNRQMYHLSDGETIYMDQNGLQQLMVQDAIEQAKSYAPQATFVRALEGDTVEKLAAMHDVPAEKVRLLNRNRARQALQRREIVCLGWKYQVRKDETLKSLAERYRSTEPVIAELNGFKADDELKPGQWIQVPGEFSYVSGGNGRQAYLQLGVYQDRNVVRNTPYDPQSVTTDIYTLRKGESLADVAQAKKVTEQFLQAMNGLTDDDELPTGRRVLVKYSVRTKENATLNDIAKFFGVGIDELLTANSLAKAEDMKPGERLEIPMGKRMNLGVTQPQNPMADESVFELVLGQAAAQSSPQLTPFGPTYDRGNPRSDK